jgi:short-subunit dehydrogenase
VGRYDLGDRVAIVTGASVGLGEEFCHGLAESGANVVLAARRLDRIERIAAALESRYGVRALPIRTDVTINISSVFGFQATRRFPVIGYYASKSGVTGLTVALAVELGKHNVRVNAIAPT